MVCCASFRFAMRSFIPLRSIHFAMLRGTSKRFKVLQEKIKKLDNCSFTILGEINYKAMRFSLSCFIPLRRLVPRRLRFIPLRSFKSQRFLKNIHQENSASNQPNEAAIFFVDILFFCCFIRLLILTHIKEIHHRRKNSAFLVAKICVSLFTKICVVVITDYTISLNSIHVRGFTSLRFVDLTHFYFKLLPGK